MFHPGRDDKAPEEIFRVYTEAGGDVKKMVMGHLDSNYALCYMSAITVLAYEINFLNLYMGM